MNALFSVVTQSYITEAHNQHVILGNSALLKCEIPSFVADFVSVVSWSDNQGLEYYSSSSNRRQSYGKDNDQGTVYMGHTRN